jgi:hypothetical protein
MADQTIFREEQRITQAWIWLLVAFAAAGAWAAFVLQVIIRIDPEAEPLSDCMVWIVWILVGVGVPLLLFTTRLTVEVRPDMLTASYRPFAGRKITPQEISKAYARTYRPIREYGGWGVRWSPSNGSAYNVSGKQGVQLELANGKRFLIGTHKPQELAQAIAVMMATASG